MKGWVVLLRCHKSDGVGGYGEVELDGQAVGGRGKPGNDNLGGYFCVSGAVILGLSHVRSCTGILRDKKAAPEFSHDITRKVERAHLCNKTK